MNQTIALAVILSACVAFTPAFADDCPHRAERQAGVDAAGARSVRVEAGSGELRIEGRNGMARVEARGTACAAESGLLDQIRIRGTRQGDVVVIKVDLPERSPSWSWNERARVDLTVELPRNLALSVNDGSGSAEIAHVGALDVRDGSGELVITDVAGDLRVDDGSGSIEIRGVTGDVRLSDGSGSIDVQDVGGSVTVERDGSGSIDVAAVKGDFTVARDGSGGIAHTRVAGQVRIPDRKR
jgi:hypothetical protein